MLRKIDIAEFNTVYEIMAEAFPKDEIRPLCEQKQLLENSNYNIYVYEINSAIAAFLCFWEFETFIFLEHFAVKSSFRNHGLGEKLLAELSNLSPKLAILEVEKPDTNLSKRRIAFYERNHFTLNHYPYIQPPISKGCNPIELLVMSKNCKLTQEQFDRFKETVHTVVYKAFN